MDPIFAAAGLFLLPRRQEQRPGMNWWGQSLGRPPHAAPARIVAELHLARQRVAVVRNGGAASVVAWDRGVAVVARGGGGGWRQRGGGGGDGAVATRWKTVRIQRDLSSLGSRKLRGR